MDPLPTLQSFLRPQKQSLLEQHVADYEIKASQILRRRIKKNKNRSTLTFFCQERHRRECKFCLSYELETLSNGNLFAFPVSERIHLTHSAQCSKHPEELDFEHIRRSFKSLTPNILSLVSNDIEISPKELLAKLQQGGHLTEKMFSLWNTYPKKFKKSLDNQANRFKRKFRKQSNTTTNSETENNNMLKISESILSSDSTENWESMVQGSSQGDDSISEGENTRMLLFPKEEEEPKEVTPVVLL